ncbi:MAG TPA: GDSL-type esterase/lipase family protein, partial [Nocardioidaceae bacterium]|nr:GDSL-type esterase/lipase family protein [Nocardioidaceae bacterium]
MIGSASYPVTGTNIARGVNQLIGYTSPVTVTPTNQWGTEVTVVAGKVSAVNNREATQSLTGTTVPTNGYVLSGHGTAEDWLNANAKVGSAVSFGSAPPTPTPTPTPTPDPGTAPPLTGTVRLMPVGDSLTAVDASTLGWKGILLDKLVAAGRRIDYVGTKKSTGPAGLKDFDHEGIPGAQNSTYLGQYLDTVPLTTKVAAQAPDVLIYHIGTNDLWSNIPTATAQQRLDEVLTGVFRVKPDVRVIVVKVEKMAVPQDSQRAAYNNAVDQVAGRLKAAGNHITVADLSGTLTSSDLQGDGIHWTGTG